MTLGRKTVWLTAFEPSKTVNRLAIITSLALVFAAIPHAIGAEQKHAPLPDKLVRAKTCFFDNKSGDQKVADSVYGKISEWGRWRFVTDQSKADILVTLSSEEGLIEVVNPSVYLRVTDRETGEPLWTSKSRLKIGAGRTAEGLLSDLKKRLSTP